MGKKNWITCGTVLIGLCLLQSCISFVASPQFIENNAQRIMENEELQRTLQRKDLYDIRKRFRNPKRGEVNFRLATILLLERGKEDVQLQYFEVITYALNDPSIQVQLAAKKLLQEKYQRPQWLRKTANYPISAPGFEESLSPTRSTLTSSDEGLQVSLIKSASILGLRLSPEKVRFLIEQYSFNKDLHPYLASLAIRSYAFELLFSDSAAAGQSQTSAASTSGALTRRASTSAASTSGALTNGPEASVRNFYRDLSGASLNQRLILLHCLEQFVQATQTNQAIQAKSPKTQSPEEIQKQTQRNENLLAAVFHFLPGQSLPISRKASQILRDWPQGAAEQNGLQGGLQGDFVNTFVLAQLQNNSYRAHEYNLIFSIFSARGSSLELLTQLLQLYYQSDSEDYRAVALPFFRGETARADQATPTIQNFPTAAAYSESFGESFGKIYFNFLQQNSATLGPRPQLQLFEQLREAQQLEILRNYFAAELDTKPAYSAFFAPFLSRLAAIESLASDSLLRDFFERSSYDFFALRADFAAPIDPTSLADAPLIYSALPKNAPLADASLADTPLVGAPLAEAPLENAPDATATSQNSPAPKAAGFDSRFAIILRNLKFMVQIVPEARLTSLINWSSLSYFEEGKTLEPLSAKQASTRRELRLRTQESTENAQELGKPSQIDQKLGSETVLLQGQNPENLESPPESLEKEWFLNWLKIYCLIYFRSLEPYQKAEQSVSDEGLSQAVPIEAAPIQSVPVQAAFSQEDISKIQLSNLQKAKPEGQNWQELFRLYRQNYSAAPQVESQIEQAASLFDSYNLWLARARYFAAQEPQEALRPQEPPRPQKYNAISLYSNYIENILSIDKQSDVLQLEIQSQFLQNGIETLKNSVLPLQRRLAELGQQKSRLQQRFEQDKRRFSAPKLKLADTLWLRHLQQAEILQQDWQSADEIVRLWFRDFFPTFEVERMQDLVYFFHQNSRNF